ncbi:right-handed parallel beta-helix repeat-containing protein [bacterium]|nr:right-handed parallel beta-helix repeat-containing protein [candidate division CSSED10-310 bacterium]
MKSNKFRISTVMACFIFVTVISNVSAGIIQVDVNAPGCVSGSQPDPYTVTYCSVVDAVADASSGDTIQIAPGLYTVTDRITIAMPDLTLLGPQANIDPRPCQSTTRTPGSANEAIIDGQSMVDHIFFLAASNIILNGLEIKSGTGDLIKQDAFFTDNVVQYCIVHHSSGDDGIQFKYSANSRIENNHIFSTVGDGASFAYSSNGIAVNNEIHDVYSEHGGFYIYSSTNITLMDNLIYDVVHATKGNGIRWGRGGYGNEGGIIMNNNIHTVTAAGICVEDSSAFGQEPLQIASNEISNVSIGGSSWAGIRLEENTSGVAILLNDIHNNPVGINVTNYGGAPDATTILVQNNNIYANVHGVMNTGTGTLMAENNWWGDVTGPYDANGEIEVPECTDDPLLEMNADGMGNDAGDTIDYCPWLLEPGPPCINDGDVDNNGQLTPQDAQMAFQIYLNIIANPTEEELCSADCNGNDTVSPADALCIYRHYLDGSCDCVDQIF